MALIPIICIPDSVLREVASPVAEVTDGVRRLLDDMAETMYAAPGIGLAAPQVNVSERLIVMDCGADDAPELYKMINPEIIARSDDTAILEEGCLSIPEYYEEVERPARVRLRFTDLDGKLHEEDAEGLYATCIQHEIDHLNGVLFVDYLSKLKRDRVFKKFEKAAKRAAE